MVLLCDCTNSQVSVNDARMQLPTKAALVQHIMRAAYQAGHCWAQATIASPRAIIMHQVNGVGTRALMGDAWEVHWTTLPEATYTQACRKLT